MVRFVQRIGSAVAVVAGLVVSVVFPDKSRDDSDYWETATDVDVATELRTAA